MASGKKTSVSPEVEKSQEDSFEYVPPKVGSGTVLPFSFIFFIIIIRFNTSSLLPPKA